MDPLEITAGRLHLRPWQAGDAPALQRCLDDPIVARWTPHPWPYRLSDALTRLAEDPDHWAAGTRAELAVLDSTTAELLGIVGLYHLSPTEAEVGWVTVEAGRGRGVAGEAVGALCRWAFAGLGLQRLQAQMLVGNWASRRVAEKAGFTAEGIRRGPPTLNGPPADRWVFSLLAGEQVRDTARLPAYPDRTDGVVTLRRWRGSDSPAVARACADPETARWLPVPSPYPLSAAVAFIDTLVPTAWSDGSAADVAVVDAVTGELLGAVGLRLRGGIGEVGYWTAPWARGRGVATRAARLHSDWGFTALGLPRIELLADVGNLASQRVADRAGFTREGVARSVRPVPRSTERTDMVVFARLPTDPAQKVS